MNAQQKQLRQLADAIYEKTDIMLNAIMVDSYDVFEINLETRSELLDKLSDLKTSMTTEEVESLKLEGLWKEIVSMDQQLQVELNRFNDKIHAELTQVTREKNEILRNKKKANQYQFMTDSNMSGGLFDKKK